MARFLDLPNELLNLIVRDHSLSPHSVFAVACTCERLNGVAVEILLSCHHDISDFDSLFIDLVESPLPFPDLLSVIQIAFAINRLGSLSIAFTHTSAKQWTRVKELVSRLEQVGAVTLLISDSERTGRPFDSRSVTSLADIVMTKYCASLTIQWLRPREEMYLFGSGLYGLGHTAGCPTFHHGKPTRDASEMILLSPNATRLSTLIIQCSLLKDILLGDWLLALLSRSPIRELQFTGDISVSAYGLWSNFLDAAAKVLPVLQGLTFTGDSDGLGQEMIAFSTRIPTLERLALSTSSDLGFHIALAPMWAFQGLHTLNAPYHLILDVLNQSTALLWNLQTLCVIPHRSHWYYPRFTGVMRILGSIHKLLKQHGLSPKIALCMVCDKIQTIHTPMPLQNKIGTWMHADTEELEQRPIDPIASLVTSLVFQGLLVQTSNIRIQGLFTVIEVCSNVDTIAQWISLFPKVREVVFDAQENSQGRREIDNALSKAVRKQNPEVEVLQIGQSLYRL